MSYVAQRQAARMTVHGNLLEMSLCSLVGSVSTAGKELTGPAHCLIYSLLVPTLLHALFGVLQELMPNKLPWMKLWLPTQKK